MIVAKNRAEVLAHARATLDDSFDGEIRVRGSGEMRGVPIRWARTCHASGSFVEIVEGDLGHAVGFDGHAAWRVDESGMPGALELGDLEELVISAAVWSGRWVREVDVIVEELVAADSRRQVLAVRARDGRRTFHLTLDAATAQPRRLVPVGRDDVALELDDFRPGGFGLVPFVAVTRAAWLVDTMRVETIERGPTSSSYALAHQVPTDIEFATGGPETTAFEWRRTRGKLPLIRPLVDGRDVGWFALDTGAGALAIAEDTAKALALPERGRRFVRTSDGVAGAPFRTARTLQIGSATMRAPRFLELDLATFGKAIGAKLAGVLGYDVFMRAVVTIDVEDGVTIAAPGDGNTVDTVDDWIPLRFEDGCPVVAVRFPGPDGPCDGLFSLDTGSSASVTVTAGAALQLASRGRARVSLRGVTGAVAAHAGTLAWFELAGHRMTEVAVLVAKPGPGAGGDPTRPHVLGSLGMGLLKDFVFTLDYPRRRARFHKRKRVVLKARESAP